MLLRVLIFDGAIFDRFDADVECRVCCIRAPHNDLESARKALGMFRLHYDVSEMPIYYGNFAI